MAVPPITKISVQNLNGEHQAALQTAISRTLLTKIAEHTFAEIIDGLPTSDTWERNTNRRHDPIQNHLSLCAGSLETAKALQATFDVSSLSLDASIVQTFQNTAQLSPEFPLRLIEITAAGCHEIAAQLFRGTDGGRHKQDVGWIYDPWATEPPGWDLGTHHPVIPPLETVFFHQSYQNHDQYPNGIADIAGYWAEAQIFGGVVLFDRGESESECKDIYLHPPGSGRPLFQLSESQIEQFSSFLTSPSATPPFPFSTFERNMRRVDPWAAWATEHIFRSRYERKLPEQRVYSCKLKPEDDPEIQDTLDYIRNKFL